MKPLPRAGLVVLVLSLLVVSVGCRSASAPKSTSGAGSAVASQPAAQDVPAARASLLEVHATFEVDLDTSDRAQGLADRLAAFARSKGGYVAESRVGSDTGFTHLVLRVPPSELLALRGVLAGDGPIVRESETATDVTDAVADLDARLHSARVEEARILKLLEERSGSIADVLAAERALADVRQRVERLDSEQRIARGRVDLATVDVSLRHPAATAPDERVAKLVGEAAHDGISGAKTVLVALLTTVLRAGPSLVVLSPLVLAIVLAIRRARRLAAKA